MPKRRIHILLLLLQVALVAVQGSNSTRRWLTLSGDAPLVIAKGGFSGIFPDSSAYAYNLVMLTSSPDAIAWCDVQLTKDGVGICLPNLKLDNDTNINVVFGNDKRVYLVNGSPVEGWFSIDFTAEDLLSNVSLMQGVYSRSPFFDAMFPILTVEQVAEIKPPGLWLNIQHSMFFAQHNLSMRAYVLSVSRHVIVNYISSPEVAFLSSIAARFKVSKTKLVFRFLEADTIEPSTNKTYGSLLKNMTFIKTFASGILVPKGYLWPTAANLYLRPHTSVVLDAHTEGLEVFASGFANDFVFSYNYSYDPVAEYLSFVDNSDFSVDGVVTDFPITPSSAIGCFSHINKNSSENGKLLVISHNGASGDYAGSTDIAYQQAVEDGTDVIDCAVQLTKDGILMCLNSTNLLDSTTVALSPYGSLFTSIPEIQKNPGIFTFDLTWAQIQSLQPAIGNPFLGYELQRNLAYKNDGKFMKLSDFLAFSKGKPVTGILIDIENAIYLAEKRGFSLVDSVISALHDAGYDNQMSQQVMIMSSDSSVLVKFKEQTKYKLIYKVDSIIRDALGTTLEDIKQFASAVALHKDSIFTENVGFLMGSTGLVHKMKAVNISVYAYLFTNEFVSQAWDFFSDPMVEINNYFRGVGVDGIITDFPKTAKAYIRNTCLKLGDNMPPYMPVVQPGSLYQLISPAALPPAAAPLPVLTESDVAESPFPSTLANESNPGTGGTTVAPVSPPNSQAVVAAAASILLPLGMLLLSSQFTLA